MSAGGIPSQHDLWLFFFLIPAPSCHADPSAQMDAVKQLNDARLPTWSPYSSSLHAERQTRGNTHPHARTRLLECRVIIKAFF